MIPVRDVHLLPVEVDGDVVRFRWTVSPSSPVFRRTTSTLRFPDGVDPSLVPQALWWRIALTVLHGQFALLRPCRVVLPVRLAPGEAETWLRLTDTVATMLEDQAGRPAGDVRREVELVEAGPALELPDPGTGDAVVSCFSGGRDSLTQLGLLQELGVDPLLVTVTSPRDGSVEHVTARRAHVMEQTVRRAGVELLEVTSDLRDAWRNDAVAGEFGIGVNETSDTLLFLGAAIAICAARGGGQVLLASELEVQETVREGGTIVPHRHVMYAMSTLAGLDAVLAPLGVRVSGLTAPLRQFQVQRLLATRYAHLRDLQYSCWELAADESACSRCSECRTIALNLLAEGVAPREIGIDLARLLVAQADWRPYDAVRRRTVVANAGARHGDEQTLRTLARITPQDVRALLETDGAPSDATDAAVAAYTALRERLQPEIADVGPEPGHRSGYLDLVPAAWRDGLRAIYDEVFTPEPQDVQRAAVQRTRMLVDRITAPLTWPPGPVRGAPPRRDAPVLARSLLPLPPSPAPPTDAQMDEVRHVLPAPEPPLGEPPEGRVLRVAETLLDGNELAYVTDCVTGNWVSSAGAYVTAFEEAFARAAGCEHAVSCSSGTTALHLMLAAAGIGCGDEVIVPTFTMIATANAVGYVGAEAVFVDSDPETWNLDIDAVRAAISPRTRAIVGVHTYGEPYDAVALQELAQTNGLLMLEDAAEAHGATLRGRRVGSLGAAASFSFYGNKILTTGEGGMVTTDDPGIAAIARELRDHGFSPERHFWHRFRAFNYRMSNLQAAIGLAQVERLDELVDARRRNAERYREALADVPGIVTPPRNPDAEGVHWMFGVLVEDAFGASRDDLRMALAAEGIETRTFFVPLHQQPSYLAQNEGRRLPVAEHLSARGLYLPSSPSLTPQEIERVAGAVRRTQAAAVRAGSPSAA